MSRVAKVVLLVGGLAVATVTTLAVALGRGLDHLHYCETGFSRLIDCHIRLTTVTRSQSTPIFPRTSGSTEAASQSDEPRPSRPIWVDVTSWTVAECPRSAIARRLLCAVPSDAAAMPAAAEELGTGLPLPKPWMLATAKNSPFIESVHVETPLGLAPTLGFYRAELAKRGWTETDGAVIAPDRAVVAFATKDGPAQLRLLRQDDRTIADLSLRKPADANADLQPRPGQVRLMLGNATDDAAVLTVNALTLALPARTGGKLADSQDSAAELPSSQKLDLPPGKYKVTANVEGGAAQTREFEVAADETWGFLVGPSGVPLPLRLY